MEVDSSHIYVHNGLSLKQCLSKVCNKKVEIIIFWCIWAKQSVSEVNVHTTHDCIYATWVYIQHMTDTQHMTVHMPHDYMHMWLYVRYMNAHITHDCTHNIWLYKCHMSLHIAHAVHIPLEYIKCTTHDCKQHMAEQMSHEYLYNTWLYTQHMNVQMSHESTYSTWLYICHINVHITHKYTRNIRRYKWHMAHDYTHTTWLYICPMSVHTTDDCKQYEVIHTTHSYTHSTQLYKQHRVVYITHECTYNTYIYIHNLM